MVRRDKTARQIRRLEFERLALIERVSYHRCRVLDGLNDLGVSGATAKVAGESETNVFFGRVRILVEQRFRHHQHSWRAIAALRAAIFNERFLNRVKLGADFEPFNRDDVGTVEFAGKNQARIDRFAVQKNRASAAVAGAAAFLSSGKADFITQKDRAKADGRDFPSDAFPVQRELNSSFS